MQALFGKERPSISLIFLLSLIVAVEGCANPSWSPDGSKIAFPYYKKGMDGAYCSGIACYDSRRQSAAVLLKADESAGRYFQPFFFSDSERLAIYCGFDPDNSKADSPKHSEFITVDANTGKIVATIKLGKKRVGAWAGGVLAGDCFWYGVMDKTTDNTPILWRQLDTVTGKASSVFMGRFIVGLQKCDDAVAYLELSIVDMDDEGHVHSLRFGHLDSNGYPKETLKTTFKNIGLENVIIPMTLPFSASNQRLAVSVAAVNSDDNPDNWLIVVDNNGELVIKKKGLCSWSTPMKLLLGADGNHVYQFDIRSAKAGEVADIKGGAPAAGGETSAGDGESTQCVAGVVDLDIDKNEERFIPVLELPRPDFKQMKNPGDKDYQQGNGATAMSIDYGMSPAYNIGMSLSPDGKTLAIAIPPSGPWPASLYGKDANISVAPLYLVDLVGAEHKVTVVTVPDKE